MNLKVEMPTFTFNKTDLKHEIKKATYSFCYMCPVKYNCTEDNKKQVHCMNYKRALEINKAIDFAYAVVKEIKKEEKEKENQK